jgi:hypothetical protein
MFLGARRRGGVFRLLVALGLGVVAVIAAPRAAHAQIVNVQNLVGQDLPEGFSGAVDATADWRTGNVELLIVSGAATVRYKRSDHLIFGIVRGSYGRVGEEDEREQIIGNTFEHLRYRWKWTDRVTAEIFVQHEFDEFRRLQFRALAGLGPRFTLVSQKELGLVVGVAYLYEREQLDDKEGTTDAGAEASAHRLSSYVLFTSALNEVVTFAETGYFQPDLTDPGDFRFLSETQLLVKLNDWLTFRTAFVFAHDASPPETVEKTDTSMQTGLSVKF